MRLMGYGLWALENFTFVYSCSILCSECHTWNMEHQSFKMIRKWKKWVLGLKSYLPAATPYRPFVCEANTWKMCRSVEFDWNTGIFIDFFFVYKNVIWNDKSSTEILFGSATMNLIESMPGISANVLRKSSSDRKSFSIGGSCLFCEEYCGPLWKLRWLASIIKNFDIL